MSNCDVCSHRFAIHNALAMLMGIHTGEKPYRCDYVATDLTAKWSR